MPLTYLDTSALVKRYVPEVGSPWITRLCQQEPITTSILAFPEIASALARRTREGALTVLQRDTLFQAFVRDAGSFTLIGMDQMIALQAASFLLSVPPRVRLRTLDALHVASAQGAFDRARRHGVATGSFITSDRALLIAAAWAGLPALNPEDYP